MKKMISLGLALLASSTLAKRNSFHDIEQKLTGKKVAILVADGFEQVEMTEPRKALEQAGAKTVIISPVEGKVQGWNRHRCGNKFPVEIPLKKANPKDYHALLLPGGVINPDTLRLEPKAIEFIKQMGLSGKPIAAICHGPWTLINAELVKGKTLTSWPSLQIDLKNAGAQWVDKEVVRDGTLVTSRKPQDILSFNQEMIKLFAEK